MTKKISFLDVELVRDKSTGYSAIKIDGPEKAYEAVQKYFKLESKAEEFFVMLTLDTKNVVTGAFIISKGSLSASIVHPREVFKRAILQNSNSLIFAHNHPSGNPKPSTEDLSITKRLQEGGRILGIDILDHIIIGEDSYHSFKEQGLL